MNLMEIKEITNKETWEDFVQRQENSSMFISWNWIQHEKSRGAKFIPYGIYQAGELVGLLPIKTVRARRGSYFHLRHAPVIDWGNEKLIDYTISQLREMASKEKISFIRISPLLDNSTANLQLMKDKGFIAATAHAVDAELTLLLDLSLSEEELLKNMRKTTRYSIRKAQQLGIEVIKTTDLKYFEDFKKIYLDAVERNKWTAHSIENIKNEFEIFVKDGQAQLFLSKYNEEFISASIFIYYGGQSIYHHSGSLSKYRNIPSTYLLQWEAIKYAKSLGLKQHNFWGISPSNDTNHPWYGLSLFKRGFGGREVEFIHAHDLILRPFAYLTRSYEAITRKLKGYN
jgi:peptidoglycan pentaglycine glycine transferase (the first glycine)